MWQALDAMTLDHDALAYKARTELALINVGHASATAASAEADLDALWAARYTSGTGRPGFGLPYAYDAFGDGTTNPSTTIYAYTTATAALAFLDGYVVLSGTAATTSLDRAEQLADTLLTDCWGHIDGSTMSVWYSDRAADRASSGLVVHNVNALTLAVLARLDRYNGTSFDATKRAGIEAMLAAQEGLGGVAGRWRYRLGATTLNDLTHHAFMVEGAVEAGMTEAADSLTYQWSAFFAGNGTINPNNSQVMGTQRWGPGDALIALATSIGAHPMWSEPARVIAYQLEESINAAGISSYASASNPRSIARYGLGLALYAAAVLGDGSLFP